MDKKYAGIQIHGCIFANNETDITEKEFDLFIDELIDIVERNNWNFGGGMGAIDSQSEEAKEMKRVQSKWSIKL